MLFLSPWRIAATLATVGLLGALAKPIYDAANNALHTATAAAQPATATVVRAVDGDTLLVRSDGKQHRVRIIGIDTPESVRPGVKPECASHTASASMKKLAPAGASVTLTRDPTQSATDRYGRWLRYATVDGRDVGLAQVRRGLADVYIYADTPFQRAGRYQTAAGSAQRHNRGVWAACSGDFHRASPR